jgi:hypothetical protein
MTHWTNFDAKTIARAVVIEVTEAHEFVIVAAADAFVNANLCCWQLKQRNNGTMSTDIMNTIIPCIR